LFKGNAKIGKNINQRIEHIVFLISPFSKFLFISGIDILSSFDQYFSILGCYKDNWQNSAESREPSKAFPRGSNHENTWSSKYCQVVPGNVY